MNIKNAIKRFIRVITFNPEVNQLQHQLKYERIYKEVAISMLNELMDISGYQLKNDCSGFELKEENNHLIRYNTVAYRLGEERKKNKKLKEHLDKVLEEKKKLKKSMR